MLQILADYDSEYTNGDNLKNLWPIYAEKFKKLMKQKLKKAYYVDLLNYIETPACNESQYFLLLFFVFKISFTHKIITFRHKKYYIVQLDSYSFSLFSCF